MVATNQKEKLKLILTKEEAEAIFSQGKELVIFYLLELSKRNDELERRIEELEQKSPPSPSSTPSGMIPPYEKNPGKKRPKKPARKRTRIIEDLQESQPEVVEHSIRGSWCPVCKKIVEPQVIDALPKATVGHRAVALTAWLHYGVGITLSQIVDILNHHFHFQISAGGLVQMWYRIQAIFGSFDDCVGSLKSRASLPFRLLDEAASPQSRVAIVNR